MLLTHQIKPGQKKVDIASLPTSGREFHDNKQAAKVEFQSLRKELIELQPKLYAEAKHKLLIIFQAMDAGGKDGTIRRVFQGVNPQGVQVNSFKVPSREELAHDFLWRIHKRVPVKGMIGVFNRSHYEDVLIVRIEQLVPESTWRNRYELINDFEKMLTKTGTSILKFYLHISKEEQRQRFQERVDDPSKNWKFSFDDLRKRTQWADYMAAYQDLLNMTSTQWAPWYVIPGDQNWYRNLAVTQIIVKTLRDLNPEYPKPEADLTGVQVN